VVAVSERISLPHPHESVPDVFIDVVEARAHEPVSEVPVIFAPGHNESGEKVTNAITRLAERGHRTALTFNADAHLPPTQMLQEKEGQEIFGTFAEREQEKATLLSAVYEAKELGKTRS